MTTSLSEKRHQISDTIADLAEHMEQVADDMAAFAGTETDREEIENHARELRNAARTARTWADGIMGLV